MPLLSYKANQSGWRLAASLLLAVWCCQLPYPATSTALELPKWFPFNRQQALAEWQEKVFRDKVLYVVQPNELGGFLQASSDKACSGLFYKIKFNVKKFPMFSWQWKVNRFPDKNTKSPAADKKGWIERDDYAARVYVIFSSWNFLATKSLEYIWDESLPEGTVMVSPYFDNIRLIVAQSGRSKMHQWIMEERNIYQDFVTAFGKKPPKNATAIALMTDADNTLSTAEAAYKEIRVGYTNAER